MSELIPAPARSNQPGSMLSLLKRVEQLEAQVVELGRNLQALMTPVSTPPAQPTEPPADEPKV